MSKQWAVFLAVILAACGGQKTDPARQPEQTNVIQEQPKQAVNLCPQSMGVTAEKLLLNIDSGLKATNAPVGILDKNVVQNECGYQVTMETEFGAVFIQLNPKQDVLSVSAGYENKSDLAKNARNMLAVIQTVISTEGRAKLGETEIGNALYKTIIDTMLAAKESGAASKDIEYGGNRYTVNVEGSAVAVVARKQF